MEDKLKIAPWYSGKRGKAILIIEEIKPVALSYASLKELVSKSVSKLVSRKFC